MTLKRGVFYAVLIVFVFLWSQRRKQDKAVDTQTTVPVLAPTERAKVIVDSRRHRVTVVQRRGNQTITNTGFVSDHAAISVGRDGSIKVEGRSWGTEIHPFVGCAFGSDIRLRAAVGLNLFYVQRWELGGGLLFSNEIHDTRAFASVGYNAYDNVSVALGIDNRRTAQLIASLKF